MFELGTSLASDKRDSTEVGTKSPAQCTVFVVTLTLTLISKGSPVVSLAAYSLGIGPDYILLQSTSHISKYRRLLTRAERATG